jgi:hypothetical protein
MRIQQELKMWLDFDHEKFEQAKVRGDGESEFYGFLNVTVTNDNMSGDSEETVITFDTGGHGGSHIRVETNDFPSGQDFTADKVTLTLYGGMEAGAFFSAMENLITSYKLRSTIGD